MPRPSWDKLPSLSYSLIIGAYSWPLLKAFNDIEVPVTVLPPDPDLFAENIFDHPIRTVDLDQGNLTTSPPLLCFFLEVEGAVFWTFSIVIRGGL
jgi:hypothetical protein